MSMPLIPLWIWNMWIKHYTTKISDRNSANKESGYGLVDLLFLMCDHYQSSKPTCQIHFPNSFHSPVSCTSAEGENPSPNECPWYDTKRHYREGVLGNVEYPSLLPGLLWLGVVVPVRIPSIGQIELFNHITVCKQMTDVKLSCSCYIAIPETILLCVNKWALACRKCYLRTIYLQMHTHVHTRES